MRDPHGVVQDLSTPSVCSYKSGKDYAGKPKFNCMATSGEGYVVVGSEDGTVRLYNNSDKGLNRASTSFPSLGVPVTFVDVTYDAEWIVATTDTYLMIIKTAYIDAKSGKSTHGFKGRLGKNACAPRLLRLKPEDWQMAVSPPSPQLQCRQPKWNHVLVWLHRCRAKDPFSRKGSSLGSPSKESRSGGLWHLVATSLSCGTSHWLSRTVPQTRSRTAG